LVIVSDDGWRDRVIEGWKQIADDLKIVRLNGTGHRSLLFGTALPAGLTDPRDVRALTNALNRELRFFDIHGLEYGSIHAVAG
jgi:hypothetical protein